MRTTLSLCIALLPPFATIHAQGKPVTTPPVAVQPAPPTGQLTGRVVCSDTNRPARSAVVMVSPLPSADGKHPTTVGPQTARVSIDGTYTVKRLAPGEYGVIAFLPGYLSAFDGLTAGDLDDHPAEKEREIMSQNGTATIAPGGAATLNITLQRGATLSGRVLYSDGSPATQVVISLEDVNARPSMDNIARSDMNVGSYMRMYFLHQSQSTDDQGHFRIAGIKSGSYRVDAIQAPPSGSNRGGGDEMETFIGAAADPGSLHVYSGDTLHKKSAKVYDLRPGDDLSGVELTIPLDAFHRVHGTLSAKRRPPHQHRFAHAHRYHRRLLHLRHHRKRRRFLLLLHRTLRNLHTFSQTGSDSSTRCKHAARRPAAICTQTPGEYLLRRQYFGPRQGR